MRRGRGVAVVVAVAAVLGLAACTTPPEVGDGSLGVTWAALPTPAVPTPKAGECTGGPDSMTAVSWDLPVFGRSPVPTMDCSAPHVTETFYVGTFAADANTDAATRPKLGTPLFRAAYETCVQQANEFLGGDFHGARVAVRPVMPTDRQWSGNARWFRCEAIEVVNANGGIKARTSSLRDGLRGDRPVAITCGDESLSQDQKYVENITYVDCAAPHDVELTGIYVAPDEEYPGDEQVQAAALDACYGIGAAYLGLTRSALDGVGGVRWLFWGGSSDLWSVGDRSHRCFMGEYPRSKLAGSIKGRRPGSFPH
jgi:Septum formation